LTQVDLVGNDTGGAIAQIYAARHPERIRSLTLTNCDCEGNFPPPEFMPLIESARQGALAPALAAVAANPEAWPTGPLAVGYEHPERVPTEVWRAYLAPGDDDANMKRARGFERLVAALDSSDIDAVGRSLRALNTPTLLAWGTGDETFGIKWAYHLRDMIPGAKEVIEIDGAKLFFPEERPDDLVPHLRRHWGREVPASPPASDSLGSAAMDQLSATLRDRYGHLGITGLREIGHGMETRVYRGESAAL